MTTATKKLEYLTTHDLVWINNIVTGKVNDYDYFVLEAAMAGQYRYGDSTDVTVQAATLFERILEKRPFADGNLRTGLIALLTFLNANGFATSVNEEAAAAWTRAVARNQVPSLEAVQAMASPAAVSLPVGMPLRKLITHECNLHVDALKHLAEGD